MCPLYPLHLLFAYGGLFLVTWLLAGSTLASALQTPILVPTAPTAPGLSPRLLLNNTLLSTIALTEGAQQTITFYLDDIPDDYVGELLLQVSSADGLEHLTISPNTFPVNNNVTTADKPASFPTLPRPSLTGDPATNGSLPPAEDVAPAVSAIDGASDGSVDATRGRYLEGEFTASGVFLGFSRVKFVMSDGDDHELLQSDPFVVKVQRGYHVLDKIFVHVVILLVVLVYINMGCAIDLDIIKQNIRKPVAPAIGLFSQYTFMPVYSYALGYLFLSSSPTLWLGLFVTGCCPGGGGSNMWTYLLGGSLDLSVTMTFFSTVAAFVVMPLWVWVLAPSIFADGQFGSPPYRNIAMLVLGLIVPISIGLLLRRFCPKGAALLKRMLKPLSLLFIVFVMTFGVYAYWFIFRFFTWQVAVCAVLLPMIGFVSGTLLSRGLGCSVPETIAISIETGLQNTGLAIGLLKVALSSFSPMGDIAMVVPIAVATLTPVPLLLAYLVVVVRGWRTKKNELVEMATETSSCITT